jgi:hypothetical protein
VPIEDTTAPVAGGKAVLTRDGLQALIEALARRGYRVVGPTLRDQAIVFDDIEGIADLPAGWTDVQDGGTYRIRRRADDALFGYAVGPHSWKNFLHPSRISLWRAAKNGDGVGIDKATEPTTPFAFIGALLRPPCDRYPGSPLPRRALCRPALPGQADGRLYRRHQLR